ncbi:MAG: T9SS type A sorting domain-containing protein [Ignavibacterium sp.]|nr:T9SS type A sorting domain-containing protein [Ignavibacterium sp.]
MSNLYKFIFFLFCFSLINFAQSEDDVVINEFCVNPTTGKEYVELLVVADNADLRNWTLSDVASRTASTGTTEGDVTLPNASYLQSIPRGTYIVIEFSTPSVNSSILSEDLSLSDATPRRLIIKVTTSGVSAGGTIDISTNENIQLYAGTRASGTLIDQILSGTNNSLISGATWGDNNASTTSDNINGGSNLPSNSAVRFVPTEFTLIGFGDNDTGSRFLVDNSSYGTPGETNTGVDDHGGALPIQLKSFIVSIVNKNILLNWSTSTEQNNYGFEIERSTILTSLNYGIWEKIGFVQGSGNSNSPKEYSFTDNTLTKSGKYAYRLKQIDNDGSFEYSKIVEVDFQLLDKFSLEQNYPNPFNPTTIISYQIPKSSNVTLKLYDILGNEVATLVNEYREAGRYEYELKIGQNIYLSSGIYFYKLQAEEFSQIKKMILAK